MTRLALLLALLTTPAVAQDPAEWKVDPAQSLARFSLGFLFTTVEGSISGVTGTVHLDAAHPEQSRIEAALDASTITTGTEMRDTHLKSPDYFYVSKFPKLLFNSTKVTGHVSTGLTIEGTLAIAGIVRPVTLKTGGFLTIRKDAAGHETLGGTATTKVLRSDWGLIRTGPGADEVRITLEVVLVRP